MVKVEFKYLIADIDKNGNVRRYVRKPKCAKIRLREKFGTPEFVQEYLRAMEGIGKSDTVKPRHKASEDTLQNRRLTQAGMPLLTMERKV